MNSGLYAPFTVKENYDSQYAGDYVLALDDWALSPSGVIDDMEWTINGLVYPNTTPTHLHVGQVYKLRFTNADRMMMAIPHPIHIHGGHFQVLSIDGSPAPTEIWLDTVEVYPGEYVDIAIKFDNPGMWMMHCHVIDHEDGGMMTMLIAE